MTTASDLTRWRIGRPDLEGFEDDRIWIWGREREVKPDLNRVFPPNPRGSFILGAYPGHGYLQVCHRIRLSTYPIRVGAYPGHLWVVFGPDTAFFSFFFVGGGSMLPRLSLLSHHQLSLFPLVGHHLQLQFTSCCHLILLRSTFIIHRVAISPLISMLSLCHHRFQLSSHGVKVRAFDILNVVLALILLFFALLC